jgi:NADP-dependent 3-hydroxy acid dehydrogenase YdfG
MADLTKQVLPIMKKQKHGQIINNASIAGKVGHAKSEFYAATKAAVMRYSEGLRQELEKFGIKVSVIYTSTVKTEFWSKKEYARRKKENWHGKTPVFLSPDDIAAAVQFIVNQPGYSVVQDITIVPFGN